jgi:hypothetical protein
MAQASRTVFPHRRNPDGSFDSICTECFRTVATAPAEAQLEAAETVHPDNCKGFGLTALYRRSEDERHPGRSIWPRKG